jgi:thiol-disulfide isomerase/thioredoxin
MRVAALFTGLVVVLLTAVSVRAQETPVQETKAPESAAEQEQTELGKAVAEAGTSPIDFTRALERHLAKYPETAQRAVIEKALAKAAIEANDHARIILYGERVLQAEPKNTDLPLIDRVARTLLDTDEAEPARKALKYAKRYEAEVESVRSRAAESHMSEGQWADELDKGRTRALVLESRATGNTGLAEEALKIARSAWETYPGSEPAREMARWLTKLGRDAEAIEFYADAFTMEDGRSTEADRARDRVHLGELYTKLNGSDKGLGDAVLQAYDRMATLKKERMANARLRDPNAAATELLDYTIPKVDGTGSLSLASLKGKAVVMDFWATWCGPCRVQHPMIENVKKQFEKSGGVVFLSIDSDDDHTVVSAFVKEMKWDHSVYYDAGLGSMLKISSIPTIIVLDKSGKISSRMAGFIPERFEDMLAQRIREAENDAPRN